MINRFIKEVNSNLSRYASEGKLTKDIIKILSSIKQSSSASDFQALAFFLRQSNQTNLAIKTYKILILIDPQNSEHYKLLANLLYEQNLIQLSNKAYELFLSNFSIFSTCKAVATSISKQECLLNSLPSLPPDYTFIPSNLAPNEYKIKHLLFNHIPKTAGVNFANPIFAALKSWYIDNNVSMFSQRVSTLYEKNTSIFSVYNIHNTSFKNALLTVIHRHNYTIPDFSFLRAHAVDHHPICDSFYQETGIKLFKLSFYRDPISRIESHINHQWRQHKDLDFIRKTISYNLNILDNTIFRTAYGLLDAPNWRSLPSSFKLDCLIDLSDSYSLEKIQSYLLSCFRLPNIIKYKRLNNTKPGSSLDPKIMDSLLNQCRSSGFINYDTSSLLNSHITSSIPLDFCLNIPHQLNSYHPITMLYKVTSDDYAYSVKFIPTSSLFDYSLSDKLNEFF